MAHATVQIHPHMHDFQQQELCKRYNIPNIPHASSDDNYVYNGGHASPAAASFIPMDAIDGDYDDTETIEAVGGVVMPLFAGAYVVATFATAPPLDYDNVVANVPEKNPHAQNNKQRKHNKIKSRPTHPIPIEEGAEICIICYERIEEERGDFQRNFCNTCKYTVHLGCIDDYIVRKVRDAMQVSRISSVGIKCLMCSKEVERVILYEDNNLSAAINENNGDRVGAEQRRQIQLHQHALDIMERRLNNERINRRKQILCNVCFLILVVSCGLGVLLSIITKKESK
jgi:hypothetical protein